MRFPLPDMTNLSAQQKAMVEHIAGGPRGGLRGPFLALLHHPELGMRVQAVGEHLRYNAEVPQSLVELVILVTARHWDCQYEWFAHSRIAHTSTDLGHDVIEDIRQGKRPENATPEQKLAYDLAVNLHRDGKLPDDLLKQCMESFGMKGLLDLVCTCGYYTTIAHVLNTAQIPVPDDADPQFLLDR